MQLVNLFMIFMAMAMVMATEKKKKHRHRMRIIKETLKLDSEVAQQIEESKKSKEIESSSIQLKPVRGMRSMRMTKPHSKQAQINLLRQQQGMLKEMKEEEAHKQVSEEFKQRLLSLVNTHGDHLRTGSHSYQSLFEKIYNVMRNTTGIERPQDQDVQAVGALLYTMGHADSK